MPMTDQTQTEGANALAHAASQYAEAKTRDDAAGAAAWQKVIYNLVSSKQHTLV